MNRKTKQVVLPLLTAMIWGSAFVAQKGGAQVLGPLSFNWTRSLLAAAALSALLALRRRGAGDGGGASTHGPELRRLLTGGLVVGTLLAISSYLQQFGLERTTAGKAGFFTALYIVLVPLFGVFRRRRVRPLIWCGVAVAVAGLYFLSFAAGGELIMNRGDVYVLLCALGFSAHILAIDHYTKTVDALKLSCVQFFVTAAESFIFAVVWEGLPIRGILDCIPFILYTGLLSSGVGYTLQILAQKDGDPTVVSLLLSLESVFAVVSGALALHERLSLREYLGCALMLCAVLLVQLPEKKSAGELT